MARKFKYDTEDLISIVKQYVASEGAVHIVYQRLVDFASKQLSFAEINYQSFTRNPEVKQFIEDYNATLKAKMLDVDKQVYLTGEKYFDARDFYGKTNNEIEALVAEHNKILEVIHDLNRRTQSERIKIRKELKEAKTTIHTLSESNEALQKKVEDLTCKNKHLANALYTEKEKTARLNRFVEEKITDPQLLMHLAENGWANSTYEGDSFRSDLLNRSLEEVLNDDINATSDAGRILSPNEYDCLTKLEKLVETGDNDEEI